MIALRGITVCGCLDKMIQTPARVCLRCDLPYSKMDAAQAERKKKEPPVSYPGLCNEIPLS